MCTNLNLYLDNFECTCVKKKHDNTNNKLQAHIQCLQLLNTPVKTSLTLSYFIKKKITTIYFPFEF